MPSRASQRLVTQLALNALTISECANLVDAFTPRCLLNNDDIQPGTLKDGYLCKVPLPRAPLQQSPALAAVVTDSQTPVPDRQITTLVPAYSQVPRVPMWSKLTHSLFGGLGACLLQAPLLM